MVYVLFESLTNVIFLVKTSDMASLLREQTRIKESLEGALERQKEGMHTIYQEIMNLGNNLGEEGCSDSVILWGFNQVTKLATIRLHVRTYYD